MKNSTAAALLGICLYDVWHWNPNLMPEYDPSRFQGSDNIVLQTADKVWKAYDETHGNSREAFGDELEAMTSRFRYTKLHYYPQYMSPEEKAETCLHLKKSDVATAFQASYNLASGATVTEAFPAGVEIGWMPCSTGSAYGYNMYDAGATSTDTLVAEAMAQPKGILAGSFGKAGAFDTAAQSVIDYNESISRRVDNFFKGYDRSRPEELLTGYAALIHAAAEPVVARPLLAGPGAP